MSDLLSIAQNLSKQPFLGKVSKVTPLDPDVSQRRYFRVNYGSGEVRTALLVQLADGISPTGGGARELSQSDCFVEVQHFFQENRIRVPQIFADGRADGFLLLEDFGDKALWQAVQRAKEDQLDPLTRKESENPPKLLMESALKILQNIQGLQPDGNQDSQSVVFERSPSFEQLRDGPLEFIEFVLTPKKVSKAQVAVLREFIAQLSEEIRSHPKVVSHYDFISYNIHVLDDQMLGLIDFQDACLESPARDLHALLCDRGMDEIVGETLLTELYLAFFHQQENPAAARQMYSEYAVHWDMRVSGRFTKLHEVDGREKYAQWIEGTTLRVFQGLERLFKRFPRAGDALDIIRAKLPDLKEKADRRDPLPQIS